VALGEAPAQANYLPTPAAVRDSADVVVPASFQRISARTGPVADSAPDRSVRRTGSPQVASGVDGAGPTRLRVTEEEHSEEVMSGRPVSSAIVELTVWAASVEVADSGEAADSEEEVAAVEAGAGGNRSEKRLSKIEEHNHQD
jgi:hypothetical protein